MATPQDNLDAITQLNAQQLSVLMALQGAVGQINAQLKGLKGLGGGPKQPTGGGSKNPKGILDLMEQLGGPFKKIGKVVGSVGKKLGVVGAVVSTVIGTVVTAATAIPKAVAGIIATAQPFVAALNPALVEQYERAQNDLRATIGYALTPIITYATRAVREFAGILLPSVQRLRPVVDKISAAFSGAASGAFRFLGLIVERLVARLERLADSIVSFVDSFGAIFEVITAFEEAIGDIFAPFEAYARIADLQAAVFRKLVTATTAVVALFLKFVGATATLAAFRAGLDKAVERRKSPVTGGLTAAPKDASTGSVEDVLKRLNERAFVSTSGPEAKAPEVALLEEIKGVIGTIEQRDFVEIIKDGVYQAIDELRQKLPPPFGSADGGVQKALIDAAGSPAGDALLNSFGPAGFLVGAGTRLFGGA